QSAHAEPVMMTYKNSSVINKAVQATITNQSPLFDFKASDGVEHTIWKAENTESFVEGFAEVAHLYIADGHHRCKSASRAAEKKRQENPGHTGLEEYNFFPAVLFPMSEMSILAYNRIIYSVPEGFHEKLEQQFDLQSGASPSP